MPVTYDGIGLTPLPGAQEAVDRWWHGHRIRLFDHPFYTGADGVSHLPMTDRSDYGPPAIGRWYWPTGAQRWATFNWVATGEQLALLSPAGAGAATARTLAVTDGTDRVEAGMWLLPERPIHQRGSFELYLLTFVDDRWWWWQAGDQASPSAPASWADLITSLFTSVGVTPAVDAVDAAYGVPDPSRWDVGYKPIPVLIDAACETVGLRVVRKRDGSVECQSYASAAAADQATWGLYQTRRLAGGRVSVGGIVRSLPASVATVFPGTPQVEEAVTLASLALAEFAGYSAVAGRVAQVNADMPASADAGDRTAYATRAATDYYLWALSVSDYTLRGLTPLDASGLDDFAEWVHHETGHVTRVVRPPYSDRNVYGGTSTTADSGFPAEITSTYDTARGYDWTRLVLDTDVPEYKVADPEVTGDLAFTPDNERHLQIGTRGWLIPTPDDDGGEPGYTFFPFVLYRTNCVAGLLTVQRSINGGTTWTTWEVLETPCGTDPDTGCDGSGWGWTQGLLHLPARTPSFTEWLKVTILSADGFCAAIDTDQEFYLKTDDGLEWSSVEWDCEAVTPDWITHDMECDPTSVAGPVIFTKGGDTPSLQVCGVTRKLDVVCGSRSGKVAVFEGGGTEFCDGTTPADVCLPNTFLMKVECVCPSIDGWMGPGWYCVLDTGEDCETGTLTPVELLDEDRCDTDIVICSCRFATEEEAEAECGAPPVILCTLAPTAATMTVTAGAGPCATTMNGLTATITSLGGNLYSLEFDDPTSNVRQVNLDCTGDVWTATKPLIDSCQGGITPTFTPLTTTTGRIDTTFGGGTCSDCDNETITVEIAVTFA